MVRKAKIKRVMLAVDISHPVEDALAAAADLARAQGAELHLVFGLDDPLQQIADLPFLREVSFSSSREQLLSAQQLGRSRRSLERRLRQLFEQTLQTTRLQGSFVVYSGQTCQLLKECSGGDVLWISHSAWLTRVPAASPTPRRDSLYLLHRNSRAGKNALAVARHLLQRGYRRLVILSSEQDADRSLAEFNHGRVEVVQLAPGPNGLLQQIELRASNTLLIPEDYIQDPETEALVSEISRSRMEVLLIR
ncbi:universal stress protein [Marinobacterium arenosum]|uniref:universal stress protein n=1 Tax=Marinobacterium arenosum TaxID=2862496 RepID=UPI001C98323B|nr:universal stress protein [Marinobacterium arenosum]MBY4675074.1 universal stress protein [Marinobacterium arenosum]